MNYQLYNGDCLNIMEKIPDGQIDMILADLPYQLTGMKWDKIIPFEDLWKQYERIIKDNGAIVLFGSQPFTSRLINSNSKLFKYEYIWLKNVPTGMSQAKYQPMKYHENILVFYKNKPTFNKQMGEREGKGKDCYRYEHYCGESNHVKMKKVKKHYDEKLVNPSSVLLFNSVPNRNGKLHPTQKPVPLLEYFIKTYTNEGELILDNVAGVMSTGVACKNLNRNFIGIELDKEYFEIGKERLNQ